MSVAARLDGTSCIVTGGAIGIGRAIAVRLAADGASVCIADVDDEAAERTAKEIGPRAFAVHCDVAGRSDVKAAIVLASGDSDYMTGQAVQVDGGMILQ